MAKRRETAASRSAQGRERAVEVGPQGTPQPVNLDALADLYEVGQWKGFPRWQCKLCPFDTLGGDGAIRAHIISAHLPPPERAAAPEILVADRFGNPVTR